MRIWFSFPTGNRTRAGFSFRPRLPRGSKENRVDGCITNSCGCLILLAVSAGVLLFFLRPSKVGDNSSNNSGTVANNSDREISNGRKLGEKQNDMTRGLQKATASDFPSVSTTNAPVGKVSESEKLQSQDAESDTSKPRVTSDDRPPAETSPGSNDKPKPQMANRKFKTRVWAAGEYSREASFVSRSGETVVLMLSNGKTIDVQFGRLSDGDQEYIRKKQYKKDRINQGE